jgi:hypothetical protein
MPEFPWVFGYNTPSAVYIQVWRISLVNRVKKEILLFISMDIYIVQNILFVMKPSLWNMG